MPKVLAQTPSGPYKFKHLTVNDGLAQNQINDIVQDSSEFIWIATKNGLSKFDGLHISNYHNIPFDTTSISDAYITKLLIDSKGIMWVGSQSGMDLYDAKKDNFKKIKELNARPQNQRAIENIIEDNDGNIWVSFTTKGLARITFEHGNLNVDLLPIPELNDHSIISIYSDKQQLFLGSRDALFIYDQKTKELLRKPTKEIINHIGGSSHNFPIGSIIAAKEENHLWLGTKKGLIKYNKSSNEGQFFFDDLSDLDIKFSWEGHFDNLLLDLEKNIIWLSGGYGFAVFDLSQEKFNHYPFDAKHAGYESSGIINCIQLYKDGTIWLGTNGYGIDIYSQDLNMFDHFNIRHDPSSERQDFSLYSIFEASDKSIWIGSYVLYQLDPKSRKIRSYESSIKDAVNFGSTITLSLSEDTLGNMWMATWDGLYKYNLESKKHHRYYAQEGVIGTLPESIVYGTFVDSKQTVWALTNSYLCKLDQEADHFDCIMLEDQILETANIFARIKEDNKGNFWINTNNGLLKYHPESGLKKWFRHERGNPNSLSINKLKSIKIDDRDPTILWIGTAGGGLNRLDMITEQFSNYTIEDGLPDNVIYGVLQDDNGHLWLSSNKGISRFDSDDNSFTNYTTEHGLQSNEFNSGAYYKSMSGRLYFGGLNGYNSFFPEEIKARANAPKTLINMFKLLDPKINPNATLLDAHDLNNKNHKLTLDHNHNVFQIDYTAMDFSFSPTIGYQYKLEGWDQEFINTNQTQAIYSNVPYGDYTFRVRSTIDQNSNKGNEASLQININPPVWLSTWALLLYAIITLALLYFIWSEINNRRKLKNDLQLEHLRSEQLKELDEFKTRFFSNISHELRTPLTLILSPLDDIIQDTENAKNVKALRLIQSNADRLLQLVNQLLDLSKIQHDNYELNVTEQPLHLFFENLVNGFKPLASDKDVSLELNMALSQRLYLFDKDILNKIVTNLLSNALKFSNPDGKVIIEVSCIQKLNNHELSIEVRDNGIGIAEEDLPNVFGRFVRVRDSNNLKPKASGTGIGLALVKELVEKCHGTIAVQSQKPKGTAFHVLLPLILETKRTNFEERIQPDVSDNTYIKNSFTQQREDTETPILLIVDDNQDILDLVKRTLGDAYQYLEANDGLEGVKLAKSNVPDIIISDVMMPKMDGYELCANIKSDLTTSHIPVVLLTAKSSHESKMDGLEFGADIYLTKPFNSKELRLQVRNLLQTRQAVQQKFGEQKSWTNILPELASSDRSFVEKLDQFIDKNLGKSELSLEDISREMTLSSRQLRRKLQALTNQSPKQYLRSYRLKVAASLLKQHHQDITGIAFTTGFSSAAYFSKCFKDEFGKSPSEYLG